MTSSGKWGRHYRDVDTGNIEAVEREHARFLDTVVIGVLPGRPAASTLVELGSGTGIMSSILARRGFVVTAVDQDPGCVHKTMETMTKYMLDGSGLVIGGFDVMCEDMMRMRPRRKYDVAFNQGVFEHYQDDEIQRMVGHTLKHVANRLVFSVPSKYYGRRDMGDERLMTIRDWQKILRGHSNTAFYYYLSWFSIREPRMNLVKLLGLGRHICVVVE